MAYAPKYVLLTALLHLSSYEQLIEDEVCLLKVEDDVELANVAVVFVHLFDVSMDDLKSDELIIGGVAADDKEEGGIASVDDFGLWRCRMCELHSLIMSGVLRGWGTNLCTR